MISVAIPTLNGAADLERTLAAVDRQRVDGRAVEVVVLDSQSADGTRAVAARHGAAVHTIARAAFTHGGARNRLMELSRGAHVAFLTQDAEPTDDGWLARLLGGFELGGDVALSCGPYRSRPGAPVMERRELAEWFGAMGAAPRIFRAADLGSPPAPGPAAFASSANLCLARAAWERVPFRDFAYAEDQQLVLDQLAAGAAKAWVPDAAVLHSHAYGPGTRLRRWFDEFRALHEVYGWTAPAHPRAVLGGIRADVVRDRAAGAPALPALGYRLERALGAALGTRAGALPPAVRRALSLERRAG